MSRSYRVIKRDGSKDQYDITKIRKVINWAVEGLEVNPLQLEAELDVFLRDDIKTKEIQNAVILAALRLTSVESPDWKFVAGRLRLFDIYKSIAIRRNKHKHSYPIYNYPEYLEKSEQNKIYVDSISKNYSKKEIEVASSFINDKYDLLYDYAAVNMLAKRYLCEHEDNIWELPQEMFLTIALLIEINSPKDKRLDLVKDTYEKLANRKVSLATPLLMNLRKPSGNLSSCFITMMDDSRSSIFYVIDQIASISKHGGGVGVNISRVRAKGSRIRGIKNASGGVIPWIRIINDTAIAVNQQGKRKGAVTVSLDMWHLDMEDFLELQTENGDQRMKAYDIFPQVVVPDLFMKRVEENGTWLLVDPHEVQEKFDVQIGDLWGDEFTDFYTQLEECASQGRLELFKFVSAKEMMKKIMKSQVESGMPYIAFKDTLNKYNPNKHDGLIVGTNLCTESHSNVRPSVISKKHIDGNKVISEAKDGLVHVCNLVSVNLANIEGDEELESVCDTSVRILDNAIDFTEVPIKEGYLHNLRYRTIGVGAMGLADMLAKNNILYKNAGDYADELFEKFALYNIKASIKIASQKGTFEAYKGSDWDKGIIFGKDKQHYIDNSKFKFQWNDVFANLDKYGIRNSQISAIAPNTSSSLIQGCTASILPIYSKFYIDTHAKGSIPICPPFIKEKFWYYQENKTINQKDVVDVVSKISKWIDTGVSMELIYNLNSDIKAKDIYETIMKAWKDDIKTIYYTRSIQKDGSVADKEECVSCAG